MTKRYIIIGILLLGIASNAFAYTPKAKQIDVDDAGNYFSGTNVEAVLQELGAGSGGGSMVYPGAGIPLSTGSAWGTSITDNSSNWNAAYGWGDHASAGYVTGTPWTGMGYLTTESDPLSPHISGDNVSGVTTNDILMYDGSNFVAVPEGTTFSYSVASFSDGQSTPQLIGTGEWKGVGALTFTASYTNGPATSAHVDKTAPGWTNDLTFLTPFASIVSTEAVNYPAAPGSITFAIHTAKGAETSNTTHAISFYNYIYWGVTTDASSFTEGDIEALTNSSISNTKGRSITVAPASGEYILYCLPTRLGTVTFTVGGFEGGFQAPETVSVTNSAGFAENYYVYRSTNSGLGSTTVVIT
jgi:hypothetical protein